MAAPWDTDNPAAPKAAPWDAKPTATKAAPWDAKPAAQPSLWTRGLNDVRKSVDAVATGIHNMPANMRAGKAELSRQYKGSPAALYKERGTDALNTVRGATKTLADDFTTPLDKTKGNWALPARAGKVGLDALGYAFSPVSAAITGLVGPEIQAATGIEKHTAGDLLSGLVPGGGAVKTLREGVGATEAGRLAGKAATRAVAPLRAAKAGLQRTFSPETVSEAARDTATLHRMSHGVRRGEAAAEHYALQRHQRAVGNATPAEQEALAKYVDTGGREGDIGPDRGGKKAGFLRKWKNTDLGPAAEAMKNMANRYRSRIENTLGDGENGPKFVQDYYARLWRNPPAEVEAALKRTGFGGGRQGSGRSLRKRVIPTYSEGLAAGLKPVFHNPLDAMNAYADNMATYLATRDTLNGMHKTGLSKWAFEGKIPAGKVPLEGIHTTKPAMLSPKGALLPRRIMVADEAVARVYNRTVGKGLERGSFAPAYRGARAVSNALTQVKLGLSAFHATVMGEEGMVSAFAKGIKKISKGDVSGVKDMAMFPAAPITTARKGGNLRRAILDPDNAETHLKGMDPQLAKLYQQAGGRVGMDRFYNTTNISGGFWRGFKNGTFAREVGDAFKRIGTEPIRGTLSLFGKAMDTISAPIFKEYVPRMKAGAWASQMEQWIKENPEASAIERQRYGEKLVNNIDNRFGELIQDNQFWDRTHFQVAQLLMLSPSWNFGTVREVGGGVAEIPQSIKGVLKGEGITDKTAYVAALASTFMIQNAIATYLHTGQQPEGEDWLAYRTGGTDQNGAPERGFIPGYMKDVLAFTHNFPHNVIGEAENKANPALSTGADLVMNEDHFGKPIYHSPASLPEQAGQAASFVAKQASPISFTQPSKGPDSGFTKAEQIAGIRRAPAYLENPERAAELDQHYGDKAWNAKVKSDEKQKAKEGGGAAAPWSIVPPAGADTPPPWASKSAGDKAPWDTSAPIKAGATSGGDVRPEFKPIVDFISRLPELDRITAENDMYHPATDVHGQGRAMDFTIKGGRDNAAAFASRLRQRLHAEGYTRVKVLDEYNNPSRNATAGHIHVAYV